MRRSDGVTLLELLTVILLAGLLVAFGGSGLAGAVKRNRLRAAADQVMVSINLLRSEAVKRNQTVSMCGSSDGGSCSGNWSAGWILFSDVNANRKLDLARGDAVLRVFNGLAGGHTFATTTTISTLSYYSDGSSAAAGSIRICSADRDTEKSWSVVVNTVGRPRLRAGTSKCP